MSGIDWAGTAPLRDTENLAWQIDTGKGVGFAGKAVEQC